jgi:hypothetical protein
MKSSFFIRAMRILSLSMALLGMMGSLVFMAHAGHQNKSLLLMLLFTSWVSFPFLALLITYFSNHWSDLRRMYLYFLMIFIAIISLLVYSGAFGIHGPHPAFVFMVVPLISWLLIVFVWVISLKVKK